jgi:hypothetical protein
LRYLIISILTILLFNSCSQREILKKESYLISIKSLQIKYSDIGIISKGESDLIVQLFSLGNEILKLEFGTFVKVNNNIGVPYSIFNSKYIGGEYPLDTIRDIFEGKPIFNSKNLKRDGDKFSQKFENIFYSVSKIETIFRDREKHIFIKISKLEKGL